MKSSEECVRKKRHQKMLVQLWSLVPVLTSATGALPTVVMKVVGLISGGKDSIYNLQLCVEQGHTIGKCIALRGVWAYHRRLCVTSSYVNSCIGKLGTTKWHA